MISLDFTGISAISEQFSLFNLKAADGGAAARGGGVILG